MLIIFFHSHVIDGVDFSLNSPQEVNKLVHQLNSQRDQLIDQHGQLARQTRELVERKRLTRQIVDLNELIRLNVGGQLLVTRRGTLTKIVDSILAKAFDGSYQAVLPRDSDGNYFLDYNPVLFTHLLDQLRILKSNDSPIFRPPMSLSLTKPFYQMLRDLSFPLPGKSDNDLIVLNVGGERIVTLRKTLTGVSDSQLALLTSDSKEVKRDRFGRPFLDYDPVHFRHLLEQLREGKQINSKDLQAPKNASKSAFKAMINQLGIQSNSRERITYPSEFILFSNNIAEFNNDKIQNCK